MSNKTVVGVIVAVLILVGLGYFIYSGNTSTTTSRPVEQNQTTSTTPVSPTTPITAPTPAVQQPVVVSFIAQNNSGQSGTAVLKEENGKVNVVVNIQGEPQGASEPSHIHLGTCSNVGNVKYPLNPVVNGTSTTTINATLADLKAGLPLGINVHKSATDIATYVACGDIQL